MVDAAESSLREKAIQDMKEAELERRVKEEGIKAPSRIQQRGRIQQLSDNIEKG